MELLRSADLVLASIAALATVVGGMGVFSDRLDALNHFAPALALLALLSFVLGVASGAGTLAIGLSLAAGAGMFALIAPELLARAWRPPAGRHGAMLTVMQFNLWGANRDPGATAAWIESQDADILILHEAVGAAEGIPPALAWLYPHRIPGPSSPKSSTLILARASPAAAGTLPSTAFGRRPAAVWASFGQGEAAFTVVGVHLAQPLPAGPQQAQSRRLATELARFEPSSLVVGGDFNSTPWSFSLRRQDARLALERRTRALATWPARSVGRFPWNLPFAWLAIDHVYAGRAWATVNVRRGPRLGSDHLAVVVVLARRDGGRERQVQVTAASARRESILPGSRGGSPLGRASTCSIPEVTSPQTVY